MRDRLLLVAALLAAALSPFQSARAESEPYFYVGPQISTLGFGGEAGVRINDYVGFRIGGNYFSSDLDRDIDGTDYEFDFQLASIGGVLDFHPFGGGFRVSGGLRWNDNGFDLLARPNGSIEIGGTTFTSAEAGTVSGRLDYNKFGPYAGIGYQGGLFDNRLLLAAEIGVFYQGSPDISLSGNGTLANDPTFLAAARRERDEIEDDLSILNFYPVVALTASYRF